MSKIKFSVSLTSIILFSGSRRPLAFFDPSEVCMEENLRYTNKTALSVKMVLNSIYKLEISDLY